MGIKKYNNTAGTAEINACGEGCSCKRTSSMSSIMSSAQEAARSVDQQQFTMSINSEDKQKDPDDLVLTEISEFIVIRDKKTSEELVKKRG